MHNATQDLCVVGAQGLGLVLRVSGAQHNARLVLR